MPVLPGRDRLSQLLLLSFSVLAPLLPLAAHAHPDHQQPSQQGHSLRQSSDHQHQH